MRAAMTSGWLVFVVALGACTIDDLELEGRACPCVAGWTCVDEVCVRDGEAPDAGEDAGRDSGVDASESDAGPDRDTGRPDVGHDASTDAGRDAPTDVGTDAADAGPTPCEVALTSPDVVFCEDFDDGMAGWVVEGETLSITAESYRGAGALESRPRDGAPFAFLRATVFDGTEDDQWLRAYVHVQLPPGQDVEPFGLGNAAARSFPMYVAHDGTADVHAHGFAMDDGWSFSRPFPIGTWVCVELHSHFSETGELSGMVEAYMDGVRVAFGEGFTHPLRFRDISVGALYAGPETGRRHVVRIDDVIASTARVGCERE